MAIVLALTAALVYGAADFVGGIASRRTHAATVVVVSQVVGLGILAAVWPFVPVHAGYADVAWGAAAGIFGAIAIAALYAALAIGKMGVVSPITAVIGAAIPVTFGLVRGERPAAAAIVGIVLALCAVAFISGATEARLGVLRDRATALALVSGLAIGGLYICFAHGGPQATLAVVAGARASSLCVLIVYLLVRREPLWPPRAAIAPTALAGVLDMSANVLYVLASHQGLLSLVAVITSLYPASTVLLSHAFLHERLSRPQWMGLLLGGLSVILIGV